MQEVKVGDVVHVRFVVTEPQTDENDSYFMGRDGEGDIRALLPIKDIVHVETRPLQVGDLVKSPRTHLTLRIKAIDGDFAWTCTDDVVPGKVPGNVYPVSMLERV